MEQNIAIIGAGFAGAILASRLKTQGFNITLFEKSRGVGGRLSSCRLPHGYADLGAPIFDRAVPDSPLNTQPDAPNPFYDWLSTFDSVQHWSAHCATLASSHQSSYVANYLTSRERQNSLIRELTQGCNIILGTRVANIAPQNGEVSLYDEDKKLLGTYSHAIVTAPAPQAVPLLNAAPALAVAAQQVSYAPSWVTIIQLENSSGIHADYLSGPHPIIARASKDSSKPQHQVAEAAEVWCIEATPQWSLQHVNSDPDSVTRLLKEAFNSLLKQPATVSFQRTHRWLFARANNPHPALFLHCCESQISAAGDWLGAPNLEGVWTSANALADELVNKKAERK